MQNIQIEPLNQLKKHLEPWVVTGRNMKEKGKKELQRIYDTKASLEVDEFQFEQGHF